MRALKHLFKLLNEVWVVDCILASQGLPHLEAGDMIVVLNLQILFILVERKLSLFFLGVFLFDCLKWFLCRPLSLIKLGDVLTLERLLSNKPDRILHYLFLGQFL